MDITNFIKEINNRQDELVELVRELVKIPSVVGDEERVQLYIKDYLSSFCDQVDIWEPDQDELIKHKGYFEEGNNYKGRPNVVGIIEGSGGGKSLILNGHIDVVSPGDIDNWQYDPWSAKIEDNKIFGRGTVDMKGGLAVGIFLAKIAREMGIELKGDLLIESVVDEEVSGGGTLACQLRGYQADGIVILEPTNLEICPASRGGMWFRIRIQGKGAHPVYSYQGVSAVEKGADLLGIIKKLEKKRNIRLKDELYQSYPIFAPITMGKISGDDNPSKIPEICTLEGMMGFHPEEEYQEARKELEETVAKWASLDPWLVDNPPVVEWFGLNKEGAATPANHPFVEKMAETFIATKGQKAIIRGLACSCDLTYPVRYGQMPGVVFGPGDLVRGHNYNEYITIKELMDAAQILANFIVNWCN